MALPPSPVRRMWGVDSVGLQQRMSLPVLGKENPPQVRMALEADTEHVVALALHPVGAAPDGGEGRARGDAGPEPGTESEREGRVEVFHARQHLEALVLPVHRGGEVEVDTAQGLAGQAGGG